jgi:hypothetical protein
MRWEEEVELLHEEMRRVLAFLRWQAVWWTKQGEQWKGLTRDVSAGRQAYAHRQADCRHRLANHFQHMWRYVNDYVRLGTTNTGKEDKEAASDNEEEDA